MGAEKDDAEIADRFAEMIHAEFGEDRLCADLPSVKEKDLLSGRDSKKSARKVPLSSPPPLSPPPEAFSLEKALDEVEIVHEKYRPEPVKFGRPRTIVLIGWLLLLASLVTGLLGVFGVPLPRLIKLATLIGTVVGLALLIFSIPGSRPYRPDDGAQV